MPGEAPLAESAMTKHHRTSQKRGRLDSIINVFGGWHFEIGVFVDSGPHGRGHIVRTWSVCGLVGIVYSGDGLANGG